MLVGYLSRSQHRCTGHRNQRPDAGPAELRHAPGDFVEHGRQLCRAGGDFLAQQRNVVLVGGAGTGKTHLAIAIARACIRGGVRGRFFNVVDLVNKLKAEARGSQQAQ